MEKRKMELLYGMVAGVLLTAAYNALTRKYTNRIAIAEYALNNLEKDAKWKNTSK